MSKIIALEVTACPFVRAVDCAPVTESPTVLLPAKVWRRPALRKITPFKGPDAKAQSELENSEEMDEMGDHVVDLDKPVPVLHHAISFGDRWDDIGRLSTDISARRGRDESPSPTVFQQRRAKYESSIERRHPVSDHFSQAPVQGNQTSLRDRRRSSFGGERIFRRWNPDTSGDVMPGSFTDLNQHSAHGGIQAPSILEDYGMEEFIEHSSPEGYGSTVPALAIKSSEMTPDDGFSSLDEYASSFDSEQWNGFSLTPPRNPFFAGTIDVTPRSLSPPVLDDATAFGEPSRPTTPVNGCPTATPTEWYTPTQHPLVRRKKRPEVPNTSIFLEPSTDTSNLTTPSLSSASSSESEAEPQETYTPPRPRSRVRPHDTQPKLRRVASSFSIAAATANFVILKPSAFLVAMMFSIAARIAARVVAGAAYSLAERGDLGLGWDVWDEADVDDYGLKPREERRLRKSDIEERRAWGLEE